MEQHQEEQLQVAAREVAAHAHCPHSGFRVGAAVLSADGRVFRGCNVESASFSLTCCAERAAMVSAVAAGVPAGEMVAMVVYTPGDRAYTCCGACRQMIAEMLPADAPITSICDGDDAIRWTVSESLPRPFSL